VAAGTFLQFYFSPTLVAKLVLPLILKTKSRYGLNPKNGLKDRSDPSKGKKRIIVEFSSPNIAKPFHAGHLRSTIIGGFLANLYQGAGWDVIRINYLGDWGRQFGLLAIAFQMFGSEEKLKADPIGHLYDIYVEINRRAEPEEAEIKAKKANNEDVSELEEKSLTGQARQYFKRMENGDEDSLAIWKRFRALSIERYKRTYARLNISFDHYSGESQVSPESMQASAKTLKEAGVSEESEGAVIVDLTKYSKKLGKAVVQKKDGTTLYLTRDISEALERYAKYHFDKMIYVVASQQDLHLAQLFKILEVMGRKDIADRCQHINFGMVLGMSTRKGTVKFLNDILKDVGEKMHEVMKANETKYAQVAEPERVADILGITSVMVQDMSSKR
jgi:arginyl-tRNA synthetase